MSLDDSLGAVLDRAAEAVETPWPPPLQALLVGGTAALRLRRARRLMLGAVTGSVLAAATVGALLTTGRPDQPREDAPVTASALGWRLEALPVGAPPASLYCLDGVVRLGSQELTMVDGDCAWPDRFAQSGDTAIALDSAASTLTLFVGDQSHQLPVRVDSESSAVVMSTDGGIVGWVSAARVDGRQDIVLWDATEGIEWKRVQAPTPDVLNLEGIDASGRVYLTSVGDPNRAIADRVWVWPSSEDGGFLRVVGLGDFVTVADVTPDGLAVLKTLEGGGDAAWPEEPPLSGVAVWGRVTRHGDFVLGRAAEVQSVVWAPDRSRYLALSSLTVVEQTNYGRTEVEIQLPTDVQIAGDPSWESNVQLLVPVTANEGTADLLTVLRCSVVFGRCEAAASGSQDVALPGGDVDNMS